MGPFVVSASLRSTIELSDWSTVSANLGSSKTSLTYFYNLTLDLLPPLSLLSDFEAWEHRPTTGPPSPRFAFCSYPFLLSLASKITLLGYEQKRSMGQEARTAFVDSILGRRFAPPILQINVRREYIVQDSLREVRPRLCYRTVEMTTLSRADI